MRKKEFFLEKKGFSIPKTYITKSETMKEELLYTFIQGLTTPEESHDVIHWMNASPENLQRLLKEKKLQDVLVWSLPADEQGLPLEDFLNTFTR